MRLNLARTLPRSAANGPGERFVVWVQGCPLACPGCWNPDTWSFRARAPTTPEALADAVLATDGIDGVTFTGGEPFAQARPLARVARRVRDAGLSVFVFTGYDLDELQGRAQRALLDQADVVVAGRYVAAQRRAGLTWRGSANQSVHFLTDRYGPPDLASAGEVEFHIDGRGRVRVTGFPVEAGLLAGSWAQGGVGADGAGPVEARCVDAPASGPRLR